MTRTDKTMCAAVVVVALVGAMTVVGLEAKKRAENAALAAARAKAEPWRTVAGWEGTRLPETTGIPTPVVAAFADDPPAPEARKKFFSFALRTATGLRAVCWIASFEKITPNHDGWDVRVRIRPHLKSTRGGVPFSSASITETWQVSRDQRATFLRCDAATEGIFVSD